LLLVEWSGANWLSLATTFVGASSRHQRCIKEVQKYLSAGGYRHTTSWHPLGTRLAAPPMTPKGQAERAAQALIRSAKVPLELLLRCPRIVVVGRPRARLWLCACQKRFSQRRVR